MMGPLNLMRYEHGEETCCFLDCDLEDLGVFEDDNCRSRTERGGMVKERWLHAFGA